MKRTSALAAWFGCTFIFLVSASTHAEIVIAESTEWVLATSDRVLIGTVIKVDSVTDRENQECQVVTIAISKTLKGTHKERETFLLYPYIYKDYAKQWKDEGIPIIFCLIKNDGKRISVPADKFAWVLRDNGRAAR